MRSAHDCSRVLVFDWDVHHGQGTQRLFYGDQQVLYISMHAYLKQTFYPYLDEADIFHLGSGDGKGFNVNIAWDQEGLGDSEYMAAFLQIVFPLAYTFDPDFVVVLAGFDSAQDDFEGCMKVSSACFAHMTHHLKSIANGKLLMVLEGGYNPPVVADCVEAVIKVLLGVPPPFLQFDSEIAPEALQTILDVISLISDFWPCFQFQQQKKREAVSYTTPCREEFQVPVSDCSLSPCCGNDNVELIFELDKKRKIGYCFDRKMLSHRNVDNPHHPEKPERIASINTHLISMFSNCVI